jgi:hypothetical protein
MATVSVRYIVNDVDEAIAFYPVELFEPTRAEARLSPSG